MKLSVLLSAVIGCSASDSLAPDSVFIKRVQKLFHGQKSKYTRLNTDDPTISVVLPCAEEREYALKTVNSVRESTPDHILKEIIVVDDASASPLSELITGDSAKKVNFLRHEEQQGLIRSKADGANAAQGDIVMFLDCHVKPATDWWKPIVSNIETNYKRVVMPIITNLDVDTWTDVSPPGQGNGAAKCYITMDAEFKWFTGQSQHDQQDGVNYVPVLSGGLLAISKQWWEETGGYDEEMQIWGGENIDQSLRVWLCGGEIVSAPDSRVAHMWRVPEKASTHARYRSKGNVATTNRFRATTMWFGEFNEKVKKFPEFSAIPDQNVDNIRAHTNNLQCKNFRWYIDHFSDIYHDAGVLPPSVFMIKDQDSDRCLNRPGGHVGNFAPPTGEVRLEACDPNQRTMWWHPGDHKDDGTCCNGIRSWDSDQYEVTNYYFLVRLVLKCLA